MNITLLYYPWSRQTQENQDVVGIKIDVLCLTAGSPSAT